MASALAVKPSRNRRTVRGAMTALIAVRATVWSGGSASRSRLGGRQGFSSSKSASPAPRLEQKVAWSVRAAWTCSWRPIAQTP